MLRPKTFRELEIGDTFYWLPESQQVPRAIEVDVKIDDSHCRGATYGIGSRVAPDRVVWVGTLTARVCPVHDTDLPCFACELAGLNTAEKDTL
jgi:hypothetical protein